MKRNPQGPIVIAAGGTGGHLFPGQALAQELRRRGRRIVLITDERVQRFDRLFPDADIYPVPAATPSGKGAVGLVRAAPAILAGVARSFGILGRIRPAALIGFGGYPTLPPVAAAILRGVPVCVHEQNAVLGRVNRLVAPYVSAIASTFDAPKFLRPKDAGKLVLTGNPVRDAVIAVAGRSYAAPAGQETIHLLVFGGSQGARVMSDVVPDALAQLPEALRRRLSVVQQARAEDMERAAAIYEAAGVDAELSPFFDDMPERLAGAHLVIGRSGASTISELAIVGRPSILVPLPHSLDNDQKANAEKLARTGAAWAIEQKNFTAAALATMLTSLLADPAQLAAAARAAKAQGQPNAVRDLADLVERIGRGEFQALGAPARATDTAGGSGLLKFATGGA
ncbi:MAG: undecaprenyldiphospho-muramoylpentapeptide beta-N-acetylglucosaminyltransferase [Parvibaculum sp.]|uniref:undecaprenyldiphospho-muramoylpentapeptide beta-N-acetylglucosaminyltransferase n=1 Tax=Parvibaculum sp. TaxID=2024848 RepID=UPI00271BAA26|nr:undecaprenyldiphospho-muramoylpentapeptide beta-N-acetylglucosaminyltransferase [Parvibaculum sp.]MDO8839861.1 undecaprenyldiphospho-muramoylpentapeptide beta-N-acetylglucosaminyltransferase [Parvibaculum sp.]